MAKQLKPGDRVQWNTSQGKPAGKVKKKLTSSKKIKDHSPRRETEYLVQSEKSATQCHNTSTHICSVIIAYLF
jgi:hypothetical protein